MKIALITPQHKEDYLVNTVLDGLLAMIEEGKQLEVAYSSSYKSYLPIKKWYMERKDFIYFARNADLIIFFWGKNNTDYELAGEVGQWQKTFFVDGSELGGNNRLNPEVVRAVANESYEAQGKIDREMLRLCKAYFRREKPYVQGIIPLPFGIERRYVKYTNQNKDIDITCIFGQEEFPPLRKEVRTFLENEAKSSNLTINTKATKANLLNNFLNMGKDVRRDKFYEILAASKVAVSVSGGGYDTARFWEILANNCILLTEKIDIYPEGSSELSYERIWQFDGLADFKEKFAKLKAFLSGGYRVEKMKDEYLEILKKHSTKARVMSILERV